MLPSTLTVIFLILRHVFYIREKHPKEHICTLKTLSTQSKHKTAFDVLSACLYVSGIDFNVYLYLPTKNCFESYD